MAKKEKGDVAMSKCKRRQILTLEARLLFLHLSRRRKDVSDNKQLGFSFILKRKMH